MSHLLKKILVSFLLSLYLFLTSLSSFASLAHAQEATWYNQDFFSWYEKVYGEATPQNEIFGERYTAAQVEWVVYGLFAFLLNHISDTETTKACIGGDVESCTAAIVQSIQKFQDLVNQANQQSSTIDSEQSLISLIFAERKFSGITYIKDRIGKFKLIPEAHAQQGFGFGALDPIQGLWAGSRNIAYGFAVIATIIFAFMIMFRVKINPQTVVTIQSAIPKVIGALILVTFSYAIAGLLIDFMYVVIGIISVALSEFAGTAAKNFTVMTDGVFGFGGFLMNIVAYSAAFFWVLLFVLFLGSGVLAINGILTLTGVLPLIFLIIIIVAAIMLIFAIFKILWLLLKTLAQTYLLVIVGPLQIMLGSVVPSIGFGQWFRSVAANLAVYPVVGLLFQLSFIFMFFSVGLGLGNALGSSVINTLSNLFFGEDLPFPTATWSPPLTLGEGYVPLLFLGISFVILTLIPKSAEMVEAFIAGKPFAYGSGIGEATGALWANTGAELFNAVKRGYADKVQKDPNAIIRAIIDAIRSQFSKKGQGTT